jgi:hypothetical protein
MEKTNFYKIPTTRSFYSAIIGITQNFLKTHKPDILIFMFIKIFSCIFMDKNMCNSLE